MPGNKEDFKFGKMLYSLAEELFANVSSCIAICIIPRVALLVTLLELACCSLV